MNAIVGFFKSLLSLLCRLCLLLLGTGLFVYYALFFWPDSYFTTIRDNQLAYPTEMKLLVVSFLVSFVLSIWYFFGLGVRMLGWTQLIGSVCFGLLVSTGLQAWLLFRGAEGDSITYFLGTMIFGAKFSFSTGCLILAIDFKRLTFKKKAQEE